MNVIKMLSIGAGIALCAQVPALAEIKINDNLSVEGYGAASVRYMDPDPGADNSTVDIDAARILFTGTMDKVTAKAGIYYETDGPTGNDFTLLDIYATYQASESFGFTAGNFLSYLGYEAFHVNGMTTLTYANGDFLAAIPAYHTGIRFDYTGDGISAGVAVVDSIYGPNAYQGDGELNNDVGFEAFVNFTSGDFTLFGGIAHQTSASAITVFNVWASYALGKSSVAAEVTYKETENDFGFASGYNWLVNYNMSITDTFSTDFRVSGEELLADPGFMKYTIAPALALTDNFIIRGEVSYQDFNDAGGDSALFVGGQVLFTF